MFSHKLKGGALYIALIICIVVGITLSAFILIGHYNQRKVLSQAALTQLGFNLKSGLELAKSEYFLETDNNKWQISNYNEDQIRIKKLQWGAFKMISVESKNARHYLKTSGLFGVASNPDIALVTSENGRPVGLAGKTKFRGYCFFSKPGFRPAFIEGQSFNSDGPVQSFIKEAPPHIEKTNSYFTSGLKKCISELNPNTDSIIGSISENIKNSFSEKTAVFQSGNLTLENFVLSGNIKIISNGKVTISSTCKTDNILIVADKVILKKGFTGSIHVIARDSIIIEDECLLNYPSTLTVLNSGNTSGNLKGIFLGAKCIINGSLIAVNELSDKVSKTFIKLNSDCEIYGLVYSSGYCHVQGKIFGSVYCDKLLLKTNSATYENHLLNAELDSKTFCASMVIPDIFKSNPPVKCCKWL